MSWILQSPNPSGRGSVYFSRIDSEGVAIFTDQSITARSFEKADEARRFIKENELSNVHIIPN